MGNVGGKFQDAGSDLMGAMRIRKKRSYKGKGKIPKEYMITEPDNEEEKTYKCRRPSSAD